MANRGSDAPRRHFTVTLDGPLAAAVHNFMGEQGFDNTAEAVRGLLRVALAALPEDGLVEMAKARAFNEVRRFSIAAVMRAHMEIAEQLRVSFSMMTTGAEEKSDG